MAPPNVRFEIDDCCSEWVYPENDFDYIHIRGLNGCVDDWLKLYQQAFKYGAPPYSPAPAPTSTRFPRRETGRFLH
jgi:hypothetical protein